MRLFSKHGLASVTIKDIAREAECAEGTLYRHYESKEEMAWALYSREMARFGEKLRGTLRESADFVTRLRSGVRLFYSLFDEDQDTFSFILLSQHNFPERNQIDPSVNPVDIIIEFITEGVRNGEISVRNPSLAAGMVLGAVLQPVTMLIYDRLVGSMRGKVLQVTDACLQILNVPSTDNGHYA